VIRVAVVDGSAADRASIEDALQADSDISVVGAAGDGRAAVELIYRTRPDVITIGVDAAVGDVDMVVREIMAHRPTPILLLTGGGGNRGERLAQLLAAGALDATARPGIGMAPSRREFQTRVKLLSRVPVITHVVGKLKPMKVPVPPRREEGESRAVVAIVASAGGPVALATLLSGLPPELSAPLLVVQHMAEGFIEGVAWWLQEQCRLEVRVAHPGDRVRPGLALVCPDCKHMKAGPEGAIRLDGYLSGSALRPSGDQLLKSVAQVYGARAVGVVLTGMGNDGTLGAASIRRSGGRVIAQDEATSTIFGMPKSVIEAGAADEILPLGAIAGRLVEWIGQ
jgi:two-component system, chemotaxis family, protein-glutamate methylesterase/glutaminase